MTPQDFPNVQLCFCRRRTFHRHCKHSTSPFSPAKYQTIRPLLPKIFGLRSGPLELMNMLRKIFLNNLHGRQKHTRIYLSSTQIVKIQHKWSYNSHQYCFCFDPHVTAGLGSIMLCHQKSVSKCVFPLCVYQDCFVSVDISTCLNSHASYSCYLLPRKYSCSKWSKDNWEQLSRTLSRNVFCVFRTWL